MGWPNPPPHMATLLLSAVRIGILPFNSSSIALVSFFIDLRKKKGKMPILAAKSRPGECSFRYILLKAVAKGEPAGPRPFLEMLFSLLGNGATSGFSQREQASPYICGIFLLNLVEKTKRFYRKFYAFFFSQIMVKTKLKNVFTKNSVLLFVSFLFLGEDFSHFSRLLFRRIWCTGGALWEPLWSKKKFFKHKV